MRRWRSPGLTEPRHTPETPEGKRMSSLDTLFPSKTTWKTVLSLNSPSPPPSPLEFQGCCLGLLCHRVWNCEWGQGKKKKKSRPRFEQAPLMKCTVQFSHLLNSWPGRLVSFLQKEHMLTVTSAGLGQTMKLGMDVTAHLSGMTLNPLCAHVFLLYLGVAIYHVCLIPASLRPAALCSRRVHWNSLTPAIPDWLPCCDMCVYCLM